MNNSGYQLLIDKLDEFIRKFYKNQMVRDIIYSLGLILGFYLLVIILDYFGRFGSTVRTFLFWSIIVSSGLILTRFFLIPLFKIFKLGKTISHEQASEIIGQHFPKVKDKLLNTLQLKELGEKNKNSSLLHASINQKIDELKPVPFKSAIDLGENKKYIKYIIPPLAVFVVILFAAPSVLRDGTSRLVRHSEEIIEVAPYQVKVLTNDLEVLQNKDFNLAVELSGKEIPDRLFLVENGRQIRLEKGENNLLFGHTFHHVKEDRTFSFYADGFYTEEYTLKALPAPGLLNFEIVLDYPSYTGFKDETLANTGDLLVPEGTVISWNFETENTEQLNLRFPDTLMTLNPDAKDYFKVSSRAWRNQNYSIQTKNQYVDVPDSIAYQIQVISDRHPMINLVEERDTLQDNHYYFTGEVTDDYGFRRLTFNYKLEGSEEEKSGVGELISIDIPLNKNGTLEAFYYHWNLEELGVDPGDNFSYYFEIWDNDGVNGSKSSRSRVSSIKLDSKDELLEQRDEKNDELKEKMEKSIKDAKDIQKELDEMRKELLQKEELSWQDKKKLEELMKKQNELKKNVEDIQKQNLDQKKNEPVEPNENILEKQKKLQDLFDKLMTEDMKKVYEEMDKLMEEMDMEKLQEQIEDMDMSNEDLEKELDRALEQFKQLEWEQKMEETIDKLKDLAEKQEELSEKSKEENADSEELKKEQEKLEEEFKEAMEDMEDLEKMNEELEEPNAMPEMEEEQKAVEEDQKESKEQLDKKKKDKASDAQKSAAEGMKKMAEQMEMMQQQEEEESLEEDMDALRALLENIITLSFDEEQLMNNMKVVSKQDPLYVTYAQTQRKLKDDAKMVEDSLFALSKRIVQLEAFVNREIGLVNEHMGEALDNYGDRYTDKITTHQQYVMTSFNNLALMLEDALKQMQEQQSDCQKPGSGSCNNPGGKGSKPSASKMKGQQKKLSEQLQKMKEQMEGYNKGESKGQGMGEMGKGMMQMAAKQRAIREGIEKMSEQLNEDGSGNGNALKEIAKEMEETEKDIVNNKIDQETLNRQSEIMSRLLKAENAEREREMDEKRKSTEALEQKYSDPVKYTEFQKRKEKEVELLRTMPLSLKPYYKDKVNEYFNKLGADY
ncbi:MAG: DUF4175 family protein [Saprospiraceae bacterium]